MTNPPIVENENIVINPLDDDFTAFAAYVWKIGKAEAWGKLSRAIQAKELKPLLPFKEFQEYVQSFAPHLQPPPPPPVVPSLLSKSFIWMSRFTYYVGGVLATLYSLYVIAYLFGLGTAIIGFVFFPLVYILLPFYTLFTYGDFTLLALNYGVGILGFIFNSVGERISSVKITFASIAFFVFTCFLALLFYGWFKDIFIMPSLYALQSTRTPIPTRTLPPAYLTTSARINSVTATPACIHWSKITPQMAGQTLCVYGVITSTYETNDSWTRIKFSEQPNTFFIDDSLYSYDIQPGDCITTTQPIRLYNRIPFMQVTDDLYYCP